MINIRHTGLVTKDINKSLFFWTKLIGFKVKSDQIESGKILDKVLGYKNVRVRVIKALDQKSNGMLELLYFLNA